MRPVVKSSRFVILLLAVATASPITPTAEQDADAIVSEDSVTSTVKDKRIDPVEFIIYSDFYTAIPFTKISLGTDGKEVMLAFDTGSPLFWVQTPNNYDPYASKTAVYDRKKSQFYYGAGFMEGDTYLDTLSILLTSKKQLTTPKVQVTAAHETGLGMNGLLGACQASVTMPGLLKKHHLQALFSVNLNRASTVNSLSKVGKVTLGRVDKLAYTGGMSCIPLLPTGKDRMTSEHKNPQGQKATSTDWWQFAVEKIEVEGFHVDVVKGKGQGIVDSGTTDLMVPRAVSEYINGKVKKTACQDFSHLPDIVFTLAGGVKVSVGPEEYVQKRCEGKSMLSEGDSMVSHMDSFPEKFIVFGTPFFFRHYVMFNYDKNEVGMALKVGKRGVPLAETCSPVTKLMKKK